MGENRLPDPLAGAGLLKVMFTDGLDGLFGSFNTTPGKVEQMLELAETDPRFKPGRWMRSGFLTVDNETAGILMRAMLDKLSVECQTELAADFFQSTPVELLELTDKDLGQRVKQMYRPMKGDPPRMHLVAKRFLTNCARAHKLH